MKIEMGESLMFSWLKHQKTCQIVESNWKASATWPLMNAAEIEKIYNLTAHLFATKKTKIPKFETFLKCAECDLMGVNFHTGIEGKYTIHAVDVAFHQGGLGYNEYDEDEHKSKNVSAYRAIKKSLRTALCIYGYLNIKSGYIYFVSPKISKSVYKDLLTKTANLQSIMDSLGFNFKFIVYGNQDFTEQIVKPMLQISDLIKNDNELWLRSIQLLDTALKAENTKILTIASAPTLLTTKKVSNKSTKAISPSMSNSLSIANYARQIIDKINAGQVSSAEIIDMQDKAMSKHIFNLNFPLLVEITNMYDEKRYYKKDKVLVTFGGKKYVFCSQWYEHQRVYLDKWFSNH